MVDSYVQLNYDLMTAQLDYDVTERADEHMRKLGYEILGAVPQSLGDCWWFTVKEIIEPLPPYLRQMKYNFNYWHKHCWKDCEYWENNISCNVGADCLKGENHE